MVLWLIYVAYLMVRSFAPNRSRAGVYAAVVGIIGFVDVPIVYFAVEWWGSLLHPEQVVGPLAETDSLDRTVSMVLLVSSISFLLFLGYLVMLRMSLRDIDDELAHIRFGLRRMGRPPAGEGAA